MICYAVSLMYSLSQYWDIDYFFSMIDLYVAPEVYKDEIFDKSIDIFSFALVLYEVCPLI